MNTKLEKFIKDLNNKDFEYILDLLTKNYVLDVKLSFERTTGNRFKLTLKPLALRDTRHCINPKNINNEQKLLLNKLSKLITGDPLFKKTFSFELPDCVSNIDWLDMTISNHNHISVWMYTKLDPLSMYIDEKTISAIQYSKLKIGNPILVEPTKGQKAVLNSLIKEVQTFCTLQIADILNRSLHIRNYSKDLDINYLTVKSNYIK